MLVFEKSSKYTEILSHLSSIHSSDLQVPKNEVGKKGRPFQCLKANNMHPSELESQPRVSLELNKLSPTKLNP